MDKPDVLSKKQIEEKAIEFLEKYSPNSLVTPAKVDLELILEEIGLTIDYQKMDLDNTILGLTAFNDGILNVYSDDDTLHPINVTKGTIIINKNLASYEKLQGRFQYTLGHETGHWVLHQKIFYVDENQQSLFDTKDSNDNNLICSKRDEKFLLKRGFKTDLEWIEWQADYFSSCVIMPRDIFKQEYEKLLETGFSSTGAIRQLAKIFEVSKMACAIRVNNIYEKNIVNNFSLFE